MKNLGICTRGMNSDSRGNTLWWSLSKRFYRIFSAMIVVIFFLLELILSGCSKTTDPHLLGLYVLADGGEQIEHMAQYCSHMSQGKYRFVVYHLPRTANEQRVQLARRLAARDVSIDMFTSDVVWTPEFADNGWLYPLSAPWLTQRNAHTLLGPLRTTFWHDQQYAVPLWANTLLLWYRKDLVKKYLHNHVPQTWGELRSAAISLHQQHEAHAVEFFAKEYEGLFVMFASIMHAAGGSIISSDGKKNAIGDTSDHRKIAQLAVQTLHDLATFPGQDPGILQADEAYARLNMENGSAAFEINWPFVFSSMRANSTAGSVSFLSSLKGLPLQSSQEIDRANKKILHIFGFAPFPGITHPVAPTMGGANLAISRYSQKIPLAQEALECLTNKHAQREYTLHFGVPPTHKDLYTDPEIQQLLPTWKILFSQLENAVLRPQTPQYQALSILVTAALSPITANSYRVPALSTAIDKALSGQGLVP